MSARSIAPAIGAVASVLQRVTDTTSRGTAFTVRTRALASAVRHVELMVHRNAARARRAAAGWKFVAEYLPIGTGALPTAANLPITAGISARTRRGIIQVFKRIADALPVDARVTGATWPGAATVFRCLTLFGRVAASGVRQAGARAVEQWRFTLAITITTNLFSRAGAGAAAVGGICLMVVRATTTCAGRTVTTGATLSVAPAVQVVELILLGDASTARSCGVLAATVASHHRRWASTDAAHTNCRVVTGARAAAVLGVVEVVSGNALAFAAQTALLPDRTSAAAAAVLDIVICEIGLAEALSAIASFVYCAAVRAAAQCVVC